MERVSSYQQSLHQRRWLKRPCPIALGGFGLLVVMLGGAWDIAWHIDIGRDSFWSPPHLQVGIGMTLVLSTLCVAVLKAWRLRNSRESYENGPTMPLPLALRINPGLFTAGVGAFMCVTAALVDELWHRLFGLDTIIWSPPHLQLFLGLSVTSIGLMAALAGELNRSQPARLRAVLPAKDADPQSLGLHLLGAFFLLILIGVLDEYHYDVPQFPLFYYPILLAPITVGSLMAGARACGRRWSASIIGFLVVGVELLIKGELTLVGLGHVHLFLLLTPVAGLAIDLMWTRHAQVFRPLLVAKIGVIASAVYVPAQLATIGWLTQVGWPSYALALATGALGALAGARLGTAMRPGVEHYRITHGSRRAVKNGGASSAAIAVLLLGRTLIPPGHHAPPPIVELWLSDPEVVVGRPVWIEVRVLRSDAAADEGDLELNLLRAGFELEPMLEATETPGLYHASVTLPTSGQWLLGLWVITEHGVWMDWVWLQVASNPGGQTLNQASYVLEMQPPITVVPDEVPQGWLQAGRALVSVWTVVLTVVSFFGIRRIESDGLAVAAREVRESEVD